MDQHQQELRRAALEAFMASLEQLEDAMESSHLETADVLPTLDRALPKTEPLAASNLDALNLDALALEAAAADIEQFIQAKKAEEK
ncbi:MAG TPA: hypothetical protein V6D10_14355 [Trichocoleus sp.]|jgi:hypothetical protein